MTFKDMIEILMNYDVIKVEVLDQIRAKPDEIITGHCDHHAGRILVTKEANLATQKEALVHELCHAFLALRGEEDTEEAVNKMEKRLMRRLKR